jgi:hypothetical protein
VKSPRDICIIKRQRMNQPTDRTLKRLSLRHSLGLAECISPLARMNTDRQLAYKLGEKKIRRAWGLILRSYFRGSNHSRR